MLAYSKKKGDHDFRFSHNVIVIRKETMTLTIYKGDLRLLIPVFNNIAK